MLSLLVNESRNDWDENLPYVLMAYRATTHDSTHCSPNLLMTGREMNLPIDIMTGTSVMSSSCPIQYVEWVKSATNQAFELTNSQNKKASNSSKEILR